MRCLLCGNDPGNNPQFGGYCIRCFGLNKTFDTLIEENPDAAYNWAIGKALDLAGGITGVEPGSAFIEIKEGELGVRTVEKIRTKVARYVPPELRENDGRKEDK